MTEPNAADAAAGPLAATPSPLRRQLNPARQPPRGDRGERSAPVASMRWTEGPSRSIYQTVPVTGNPNHSRAARHQWMHARRGAANQRRTPCVTLRRTGRCGHLSPSLLCPQSTGWERTAAARRSLQPRGRCLHSIYQRPRQLQRLAGQRRRTRSSRSARGVEPSAHQKNIVTDAIEEPCNLIDGSAQPWCVIQPSRTNRYAIFCQRLRLALESERVW